MNINNISVYCNAQQDMFWSYNCNFLLTQQNDLNE